MVSAKPGVISHVPFIERNMAKLTIMIRTAVNWRKNWVVGVASEIRASYDVLAPPVNQD